MNLAEMRTERAKLVKDMRAINDAAEGRAWTADETEKYNKLEAEVDRLSAEIEAGEQRAARAAKLADIEGRLVNAPAPATKPSPGAALATAPAGSPRASEAYRSVFDAYLQGGLMAARQEAAQRADTLQIGLFTKGGALVGPEQFVNELLKGVDDMVFVRKYARRFQLAQAISLGVPRLDTDVDDADWTAELATGSQGDLEFGKRELKPHPMAKRVKVSKTLARVSAIPIQQLVRERLAYKFALTEEKAFLTGSGAQQPLGIFTASNDGVPTSRDVSTDNTATAITADGLINAKFAMKSQHWAGARWLFHRDAMKAIRKLKDGNGQYLWAPGLGNNPNTLLDLPFDVSEHAPNTFTSQLYVGALCNWAYYWIADALDMTVQVLDQLYAETNQDGFIGRAEVDGAPVLAEAFVRVKLA